jgi:predicted phage terminase large subunit-like protein
MALPKLEQLREDVEILEPKLHLEYEDTLRLHIFREVGVDIDIPAERIFLAENKFIYFCLIYLSHYFNLKPAEFHQQLVDILEDSTAEAIGVIGFRGSAKSTFASLAYPLWCAVYKKFNFLVLINDTTPQVKLNIANIKAELEENELLRSDFPNSYNNNKNKWTETELLIGSDVFLMGKSRGQKIRGLRFRQYRPELIIIDDPEDLEWTRKKDNRDKTERWLNAEVVPAQEENKCKLILIGNLLHKDALMSRIKKRNTFKIFEFSLLDAEGNCTWAGKYPTQASIDKQKERVGNNIIWQREYLLKILAEEEQVVKESDIVYYENERLQLKGSLGINAVDAGAGVDLAISEKQTADFTAMVAGIMAKEYSMIGLDGENGEAVKVIYIKPNPVNLRLDLEKTIINAKTVHRALPMGSKLYVESVAYQLACIKEMRKKGLPVVEMRPISDKRARLETVAMYIKQGLVRFPKTGAEDLIEQLLGFGIEEHDDMVDALVYLLLGMFGKKKASAGAGRGDTI